jgi:Flp pilus assembly protein TadG
VMRRRDGERGAAAVEFAFTIPIVLIVVFAGLNIGRAISARSRLADAAGFAARTESIAARSRPGGQVSEEQIRGMVQSRLAGGTECSSHETAVAVDGVSPYRFLRVSVTCTLTTILVPFLGNLGLTQVSATAAMPIDFEP